MTADATESRRTARGRPSASERRQVVQDLLRAVGQGLETKTHHDLTLREIAAMAGVNESMISYYFGSKDGLLIMLLDEFAAEMSARLRELDLTAAANANPMRLLVETLIHVYYGRIGIVRAVVFELMRKDSSLEAAYKKRKSVKTSQEIMRLLQRVIDAGDYRADIDLRFAALSVMSLVLGPLIFGPGLSAIGLQPDDLKSDAWIDYLGSLLDHPFRRAP